MDTEKRKEQARIRQQRARNKIRDFVNSYKTKCAQCGMDHPGCLVFHHRNPADKKFSIQNAVARKVPKDQIIAEIAKCDILCANCHSILHWDERNSNGLL
jgi:predicted HNH restriction endonuclease